MSLARRAPPSLRHALWFHTDLQDSSQRKGDKAETSHQTRSLGVEKMHSTPAERAIVEAPTSGDVDESELELHAELRQVSTNVYIELR